MINLLFGDWEIIGEENEMRSEVLGVNKNSPIIVWGGIGVKDEVRSVLVFYDFFCCLLHIVSF